MYFRSMSHNYTKLKIYELSISLASSCLMRFEDSSPRVLGDHIMKTAISIPSNIAEGSQRGSNKDFIRFLTYATGSCAELHCQLSLAKLMNAEHENIIAELLSRCQDLLRAIWGFINSLKNCS